jgi:hypothetical protein
MKTRIPLTPIFLTLVGVLNSAGAAYAGDRCVADLGRVNPTACVGNGNLEGSGNGTAPAVPLAYNWQLDDSVFDLVTPLCLTAGGPAGSRSDMILALDRSQSVWAVDGSQIPSGNDNLSDASYVITKLAAEAATNPTQAPKVGLVLFSSVPGCTAYAGGDVVVDREFPCLYISAKSVADTTHVANLQALLQAASGKYSEGGLSTSGDLTIVAQLLAANGAGLAPTAEPDGVLLFSDGRSFTGQGGDAYAYLESAAYVQGENNALKAFSALKTFRLAFALPPTPSPAIDATNADAYDTMCGLPSAPRTGDCDTTKVTFADPATWPVNKINIQGFAANLANATGNGPAGSAVITAKAGIDALLDTLRASAPVPLPITGAVLSVNGAPPVQGIVTGTRAMFPALPAGQPLQLEVTVVSGGAQLKFPLQISTTQVADNGAQFTDQEMQCAPDAVSGATVPPGLNLSRLQGGSASCGVTRSNSSSSSSLSLWFLLLPLALPLFLFLLGRGRPCGAWSWRLRRRDQGSSPGNGPRTRRLASFTFIAFTSTWLMNPPSAKAETTTNGLNALQYRPVVDGVANTEKATTLPAGTYNAGLFVSYASDPLDLGGDKDRKISAVMTNLTTAHAVANIGILDRVTLGIHVPYVHNSEEDRAVSGTEEKATNLGRPSDVEGLLKINVARRTAWALGVAPLVTIPTGDPSLLIGDGTANYGGLLLASGALGQWSWAFDAGYLQRQKALQLTDDRATSITVTGQSLAYGGVEYRPSSRLAFGGSVQGKFASGQEVDFTNSSPAEWSALTKFRPAGSLELEGGFGTGIGKGYGSPAYRVFAGVTYVPDSSASATREPGRTVVQKPTPPAPVATTTGVARTK